MQTLATSIISDASGNPSSMRVALLLCVGAAIFLAIWPTVHNQPADVSLIITFLGAGFTGKVIQKGTEGTKDNQCPNQNKT